MKLERFGYTDKDLNWLKVQPKSAPLELPIIDTVSGKTVTSFKAETERTEDK